MEIGRSKKAQPSWAQSFMTAEEIQRVSDAVAKAETTTSGEIVPVIVRRSSTIGHVPWLITLILLLTFLVFEIPQMEFIGRTNAYWLLLIISAVSYLISLPLAKLVWIQRLLVPVSDQAFQVEERALIEFYQAKAHDTKERTGVLLFLSLMERKAVVLADEGISKKLPQETWTHICQDLVDGIQRGRSSEGLITAIQRSGELLAQHFPHQAQNENELSNQLILKE